MNNRLILPLILAVLAGLFIIQNVTVVEIRFLFWSLQMSRSLFMILLLAVGIAIGWFLHSHFQHKAER